MFKFLKNLFGKKEVAQEQVKAFEEPQKLEPVQAVQEPVKVIEERLAEVAEKKVVTAKAKVKKTTVEVNNVASDEVSQVVKKPRRRRKPKPKTDKPADGEQK